ncbi:MAG: GNAT family protein [Anaerolineales bacterium]
MHIESARLRLRNFTEADEEAFFLYRNEPQVAKYQGWEIPYPRERARQLIQSMKRADLPMMGAWTQYAVALKSTDELAGDIGCYFKKEDSRQVVLGFTIAPRYWRNGYASEILQSFLGFLFERMNVHRVSADCDTENIASYRTLEKLGFRREAHFIESFLMDGAYTSEYYYAILEREWQARRAGGG